MTEQKPWEQWRSLWLAERDARIKADREVKRLKKACDKFSEAEILLSSARGEGEPTMSYDTETSRKQVFDNVIETLCTISLDTERRIVDLYLGERDDAALGKILRDEYERYVKTQEPEPFMARKQAD